jgi:putative ABC transport system permease protein
VADAARWRRYLRFWRPNVDADVDEEIRFHMEEETEALVARGMSPALARDEALRRFGDVNHFRRECRSADERRLGRELRTENLSVLAQDLRYALRSLRHNPLFAGIAIVTLALGIGANTAIFSVVNGVLLKPLPYREPGRLVTVWETMKNDERITISYWNYLDWRQRQRGYEDITVWNPFGAFTMTGNGAAERVRNAMVGGNYFQLLGVRPALGRLIEPRDDSPSAPRVVVLSYAFFQGRFAADASLIGKSIILDEAPYTVIGVLPPEVRIANRDAIIPLAPEVAANPPRFVRENHGLYGIGRLKPGVTLDQARADLQRVSAELRAEYPTQNVGIGSGGQPMIDTLVGRIKPALHMLMVAVGLVLLIACANVANLVLSRSASRQREFALRTALGAARGRLVRQLLTESLVLSVAGGALGVGIALAGVKLLMLLDPGSVPRLTDITVDRTVLLFAAGVSLLTGVLFGLGPALQSGTSELVGALKEGGRGAGVGRSRHRTRAVLTVAEVALAVVLLAGAGLLLRSFEKLTSVDPGFDPTHVLTGRVAFGASSKYLNNESRQAAFDALLERVRAIPGVESATIGGDLPTETSWQTGVVFEAIPEPDATKRPMLNAAVVDPTYFETLRIPLVAGRHFSANDGPGQPRVVLISESAAKKFFPKGDVLGQRMIQGGGIDPARWMTIVGVVKDTRTDGLTQQPRGNFYMPRAQEEFRAGWLMVRSSVPTEQLTASVRRALAEVNPNVPLALVSTMDATLAEYVAEPRFSMLLVTIFAGVALLLASVGIYGVISYNVTQRSNEIGVRMALGAQRRDVVGLVVGQAMTMAAAGVAIGVLLALWGSRMLSSMLFGVGPRDPLVLGSVAVFLILVALAAALAPALRAARIDPTVAIRAG